jgi:hypothetical protein
MARQPETPYKSGVVNKTPAPTQRPPGSEKDFTFGRQSYGANAYGGPSSLAPGHKERASLTVNNDDSDAVLDAIKQHGTAAMRAPLPGDDVESVRGTPATQVRDVSAANKTPIHPAMVGSNAARQPSYPGPKSSIPGALTDDQAPVPKPSR